LLAILIADSAEQQKSAKVMVDSYEEVGYPYAARVVTRRPLRIITDSWLLDAWGGLEFSTLHNSLALAERGHKLFVAYGHDGSFRSRYEDAGIELKGPVSFKFDVHRPLGGLKSFIEPAKWARAKRPDVIWLNRIENIHWAQAVATWSGCPLVCHLHNMPHPSGASRLRHNVAQFVAVSNFMRDAWVEVGVNPRKICVIKNSLPKSEYPRGGRAERDAARRRLGLPPDIPIVLCYGRMTKEKGVGTILDAWVELQLSSDQALLVLVGSPSPALNPEFEVRLQKLKPETFRWFPMQNDVVPFLHAADLVVFPTLLEEGFGRVAIEGMKTGRPVIASRIGALPEVLSGPMSRFLFEPGNSKELATLVTSLLDWRQREPHLETECAKWEEETYPFDVDVDALEDVLLRFSRRSRRTVN
jgi:glycosyltransferase involved in cell wall biosynthesis